MSDSTNVVEKISFESKIQGSMEFGRLSFGTHSDDEILNRIMIVLHNLATLKDHTKNALRAKGHDPQIVEPAINNSTHLKVLVDIVNQEKHGSQLRNSRSGSNPRIANYSQRLRFSVPPSTGSVAGIHIDASSGNPIVAGNCSIIIWAEIVDGGGKHLFSLDELVESCYAEFGRIAGQYLQ